MSILIDSIRISGFRGIKNIEISLSRITILIGTNNAGKTSVLKALQLSLGDYARNLAEEDFYIASDEKRAEEILVDVRIVPVDSDGNRKNTFDVEWAIEFGDKIKAEPNGSQFVAIRTRSVPDSIKGAFDIRRYTLEKWPNFVTWQEEKIKEYKMPSRLENMPLISIEAQRDIHQELKEKSSFIGKVLASVKYNSDEVISIESQIKIINDEAVNKSGELQRLKTHLNNLSQSFKGSGNTEITPFPKKIRDLSKYFSVHFGESSDTSFPMEYHGMGTRSWASMLSVKAFIELMAETYEKETSPFFPILSAEEPEAHLHPDAQKSLYHQLADTKGQIIVSTHSPYLASLANQQELRFLRKSFDGIAVHDLVPNLDDEDRRKLHREIIHSRGEILFSRVLVFCEGETEEQALPILFNKFFGKESFMLGINFVGVGGSGKKYLPFFKFAHNFCIPVFIFSDGEEKTLKELKSNYEQIFGPTDILNCDNISVLNNTDFEGYLISSGFKLIIEEAIKKIDGENAVQEWIKKRQGASAGREQTDAPPCPTCHQNIYQDIIRDYHSSDGFNKALADIIDSCKTKYAPVIAEKLCDLEPAKLPPKIIELFNKIQKGVKL